MRHCLFLVTKVGKENLSATEGKVGPGLGSTLLFILVRTLLLCCIRVGNSQDYLVTNSL